jgi:hypothetical protein
VGRHAAAWVAVQAMRVTSSSPLYTVAKRPSVGSNEQGLVDAFNTLMLPLTQSG